MNTFVTNLRQEVMTSKLKGVSLESDLRNLDKVYVSGASEAVVFYCARIQEAILKHAHLQFFGEGWGKQPPLAEIEQNLYDYNLLRQSRFYWAKGLRLLGNEARHELRRINSEEADFALIFLEFILSWYFCDFHLGLRLPTIHKGQSRVVLSTGNLLSDLAWTLDSSRLNPQKLTMVFGPQEQRYLDVFSRNFTFPLLLIEIFIALGDYTSAERLIAAMESSVYRQMGALKNRFSQLKGLLLSSNKKLEEALQVLEIEYARQQSDRHVRPDDETVGILAGVYKKLWQEMQKESWLSKSHETYRLGWRNSRNSNTYLGINASSTALWLGKSSDARNIAREVKGILDRRRRAIQQKTESRYDLNYWDMGSLAEASLLVNDLKIAGELYDLAFSRQCSQSENISVTRKQLAKLVSFLNLTDCELKKLNYSGFSP